MHLMAFDTLKYAQSLQAAGMPQEEAEALAAANAEAFQRMLQQQELATKADIAELHADIEKLRLATKSDLEALRLASKSDLEKTEAALRADLGALRTDLEKTEAALRADLEKYRLESKADLEKLRSELQADINRESRSSFRSTVLATMGMFIAFAGVLIGVMVWLFKFPG